jgi:predicted SprT family Zn-dependent metalloprotease
MHENLCRVELQEKALAAVRRAERRARVFYAIKLPEASLDFSLRGRCAGQAVVERTGATRLRINLQLLRENLDDYLIQTVPHEISHLVVNWQARNKRSKPRPHGTEWQAVMRDCFGLEAKDHPSPGCAKTVSLRLQLSRASFDQYHAQQDRSQLSGPLQSL